MTFSRPVCLYGWVFLYLLSGCEFESRWSHLSYSDIVPVLSNEVSDNFSHLRIKIHKTQWLTLAEWGYHLDDGPKLAMGLFSGWWRKVGHGADKQQLKKSLNVYVWHDKNTEKTEQSSLQFLECSTTCQLIK